MPLGAEPTNMDSSQQTLDIARLRHHARRACLRTDVEFYLRSVARRWKREVKGSERILVLSPYLTSTTAEAILGTIPGDRCDVYTAFNAENFASGASSIHTLMKLQEHGCMLYDLRDLHAKIVLVPGSFASIGSQNVTRQGTLNKEATSVFTDPDAVAVISAMVEPWLEERRPITSDMIDDMNLALPPLIRDMRKARRACQAVDERVLEDERLRVEKARARLAEEERLRLEAEARRIAEVRQQHVRRKIAEVTERVQAMCPDGRIDWATAGKFVEASVWWLKQRWGPARAPRHKYNLYGGDGNWKLDFGSNTFHVADAIKECTWRLKQWLDRIQSGDDVTVGELQEVLRWDIQCEVSNFRGDKYINGYNHIEGDDMIFGSSSVDLGDFIRCFLRVGAGTPGLWTVCTHPG
jgi:hypothetical protein